MINQKDYNMRIICEGRELPTHEARGTIFIEAPYGLPFQVTFTNKTFKRMEVVVSIDGKSIMTGKDASPALRGYVIEANSTDTFEGWRLNDNEVAEFKFGTKPGSYAAKMSGGDTKNVGIIGVATFLEKSKPVTIRRRTRSIGGQHTNSGSRNFEQLTSGGILRGGASGQSLPEQRLESFGPAECSADVGVAGGHKRSAAKKKMSFAGVSLERAATGDLGTAFGEAKTNTVTKTTFVRDQATRREFSCQYATHENLVERGIIRTEPTPNAWPGRKPTGTGCTPPSDWRRH